MVVYLSWERKYPSLFTIFLMILPLVFIAITFTLTDYFSVNPTTYPPPFNSIVPLILLIIGIISAAVSYTTARDEEPEWGSQLPFKIVEGVDIASVILSMMFIVLIVTMYFMK